jgi:hypothetical protein
MKTMVLSLAVALLAAMQCQAVKITAFTDTDTFIGLAKDVVIAKCTGLVPDASRYDDGVYPVDVQVISVLHGAKDKGLKPGKAKIATIYPMETGKTYMLTSMGGSAHGTVFLAIPEMSVVELPPNFQLGQLKDISLKEQVLTVFAARRRENERQQRQLEAERKLLDKAIPMLNPKKG